MFAHTCSHRLRSTQRTIAKHLAAYNVEPHAQADLVEQVLVLAPTGEPEWMSFHPHRLPKCLLEAVPPPVRTLVRLAGLVPETFGDPKCVASYETATA